MNRDDLPDFEQFLVICFNQDWKHDYPNANAAVDEFIRDYGAATIDAVATQLDYVLRRIKSDDELDVLIYQLGCYYLPSADGFGMREWLTAVHGRLRSALPRKEDRS